MKTRSILGAVLVLGLAANGFAQTWPNLPTTYQPANGYADGFESYAGVVPSHMAINSLNSTTSLPDPEGWCNIGQLALPLSAASGVYCLEMGLIPGTTNYHNVRNGLILGLDGTGAGADLFLRGMVIDYGEETNTWEGAWVSNDGLTWYQAFGPWNEPLTWQPMIPVNLSTAGASTAGQFYLLLAQEDNFPYAYLDGVGLDDLLVDTTPAPLPFANLPSTFQPAGSFFEDFESLGGVVPSYMGVNASNGRTYAPDPEAWCNVGQNAPALNPFSGMYCLEMAKDPATTVDYAVLNGLVLGLDGSGIGSDLWLDFQLLEYLETSDPWDGVFLSDDGATWTQVYGPGYAGSTTWKRELKINLNASGVNVSGQFYLLFAEYGSDQYGVSDGIGIDDIAVNTTPPPPPFPTLPTAFVAANGYSDDFESYAGVVPAHFGINSNDALTGLPDPLGWCNIGQLALPLSASSGIYCLEMGLIPGTTSYHNVRNGLVIGLNGAGASQLLLDFRAIDHGEETQAWDGVWVSDDGLSWARIYGPWTPLTTAWQSVASVDITSSGANTNGDFYLLFAQEDNFPYGYLDGLGVDDVTVYRPAPVLSVSGLVAGGNATVQVVNATPGGAVRHGYSLAGGGPVSTPYGDLLLSPPYKELPAMTADPAGVASFTGPVPAGTTGLAIWLHAFDLGSLTFSNGLAAVIG